MNKQTWTRLIYRKQILARSKNCHQPLPSCVDLSLLPNDGFNFSSLPLFEGLGFLSSVSSDGPGIFSLPGRCPLGLNFSTVVVFLAVNVLLVIDVFSVVDVLLVIGVFLVVDVLLVIGVFLVVDVLLVVGINFEVEDFPVVVDFVELEVVCLLFGVVVDLVVVGLVDEVVLFGSNDKVNG